jgi:signal transduction histidine kinase
MLSLERIIYLTHDPKGQQIPGYLVSLGEHGVGIKLEYLTRIFTQGFTTRRGGHGFGLHSRAWAAKIMGASLSVSSHGEDQGATFTLELPAISVEAHV